MVELTITQLVICPIVKFDVNLIDCSDCPHVGYQESDTYFCNYKKGEING